MSTRSLLVSYDPEKKIFLWCQKFHDGYANTEILNEFFPGDAGRELMNKMISEPCEIRTFGVDLAACDFRPGSYNHGSGPIFSDINDAKKSFEEFKEWIQHFDGPEYTSFLPGNTWLEFETDSFYPEPKPGEDPFYIKLRAELGELFHFLLVRARGHLEKGALIPDLVPRAKKAIPGKHSYAYAANFVNGIAARYPERVLLNLADPEIQKEINEDFNIMFGCRDGWPEFQRVTGAKLILARNDGRIFFKINPRFMANHANVVAVRRNEFLMGAEFYKLRTKAGVKRLEKLPDEVSSVDPLKFRVKFREATALQTCMPTIHFA